MLGFGCHGRIFSTTGSQRSRPRLARVVAVCARFDVEGMEASGVVMGLVTAATTYAWISSTHRLVLAAEHDVQPNRTGAVHDRRVRPSLSSTTPVDRSDVVLQASVCGFSSFLSRLRLPRTLLTAFQIELSLSQFLCHARFVIHNNTQFRAMLRD